MKKTLVKGMALAFVGSMLVAGSAIAGTIPTEWLEIFPTDLVADGTQLPDAGTGPAYYVWTNDENRTEWNVAWTGGGVSELDKFSGQLYLQNSAGDFETFLFEYSGIYDDELVVNATIVEANETVYGTAATLTAWANTGWDGFTLKLTDWTLPSYVGFDLKAQNADGSIDMSNLIYLGANLETVASLQTALGQTADEDFRIAAPVPEPATMLLMGTGLAGLAGAARKRRNKKA